MIRSMTGFGRSEYTEDGTIVSVEISSVNGRFFDFKVKKPKSLNDYDAEIRKMVQGSIERGRVSVAIVISQPGSKSQEMSVDYDVAAHIVGLAEEMASRFNIENTIDTRTLLTHPEVIRWEDSGADEETLWDMTKQALNDALEKFQSMRENEGEAIGKDASERVAAILKHVEEIEKQAPEIVTANTARLRKKIDNLMGKGVVDENRFAMEVAVYSERVDVTEECVRLRSHCDEFSRELSNKRTSGRKLSFLLQEMNREANTIGSKIMDANISQTVVGIKEELEKVREQAENME